MTTLTVEVPKQEVLLSEVNPVLKMANDLIIDDDNMFKISGDELIPIKERKEKLDAMRTALVKPLNDHVKMINDLFRAPISICTQAEDMIKGKQRIWIQHKDKLAADARREQDRLDAIARQEAAAEAKKLLDEAAELQKIGNTEEAAVLQEQAAIVEATPVMSAPVVEVKEQLKGGGTTIARPWKAEVVDKQALVRFIGDHPEYIELIEIKASALNQLAKAQKANLKLDGVKVFQDIQVGQRK